MSEHIIGASQLLSGKTEIVYGDYRSVLENVKPSDIVYMDPPYQGVCGNRDPRYIGGLSFDEFTEALHILNKKGIFYILSYDGRTGPKTYGKPMPCHLHLTRIEMDAGRSSQATLLGRDSRTYESIYLSPALSQEIEPTRIALLKSPPQQLPLLRTV